MQDNLQKNKANVVNLYFGAALIVLVLTTVLLVTMLKSQSTVNFQAKLLLEQTATNEQEINQQTDNLSEVERTFANPSTIQVLPITPDTNQITRMFDDYFASLPGNVINSTLSFTDFRIDEELNLLYTDASLNITSDESNFYNFLRFTETSGLKSQNPINLMEVRSININFAADDDQELNYRVTVRIYFSPGLNSNNTEEETQ